jgi:hypothetical protein
MSKKLNVTPKKKRREKDDMHATQLDLIGVTKQEINNVPYKTNLSIFKLVHILKM